MGCKLNQAEQQEMARDFESRGFVVVGPRDVADVYVINTCTVTAEADRKVRQWLRSVRRRQPGSILVATGCAIERMRDRLESLADLLIDNREKRDTVALVVAELRMRESIRTDRLTATHPEPLQSGRTRSLVKVQEGCATPCAYCIVPLVRGSERSVAEEEVLDVVRARIASGTKEIVLTGTKIGVYRDGDVNLARLVRNVLDLPGLRRLRLSSLQPQELSEELLILWEDSRLCRHFHLSLQSGSDTVLRRMGRGYSVSEYRDAVMRIRTLIPGVAITTDAIVGFPGETDEEFESTVSLCGDTGFARIHVFPYSRRPGTVAADMPGQVAPAVIRQRCRRLEQVGEAGRAAYERSWLGHDVMALWEDETFTGSGIYGGTSDNYLRVLCHSALPLQNTLERVTLMRPSVEGVWVRRADEDPGRCEAELEGARY